jgi:DnaJ homolog subfamily C member 28
MSNERSTEPDHDATQQPSSPRQPLTQRTYHTVIDRQIAAGEAAGAFENLPGAGKPQRFDDDAYVPDELKVGYRMLKTSGFAPPWIELQKEITAEQAKLESWRAQAIGRLRHSSPVDQARLRDEYRERITALNRLILNYNLVVPQAVGQLPMLRLQEELARFGT